MKGWFGRMADFVKGKAAASGLLGDGAKRVAYWREKLEENKSRHAAELALMEERDALYNGTLAVDGARGAAGGPAKRQAKTVYNLAYELIESEVDSSIPAPRVAAKRAEDAPLAAMIEDYLRAKLDELPFEELNDLDERNTYNQGGDMFLLEWDMKKRSHTSVGDIHIEGVHPRQLVPQHGVTSLCDMDYFFIQKTVTRKQVKRRYGVELPQGGEEDPGVRGGDETVSDELVTLNVVYYLDDEGRCGRYVFSGDTELEHAPDYQARKRQVCARCGAAWPDGEKVCGGCGGKKHKTRSMEFEELDGPLVLSNGEEIAPVTEVPGEDGQPVAEKTRIPCYVPGVLPVVLRKNVSKFGSLLGTSDIDMIRPQQDAVKKLGTGVLEKLLGGGSAVTLGETFVDGGRQFTVTRVDAATGQMESMLTSLYEKEQEKAKAAAKAAPAAEGAAAQLAADVERLGGELAQLRKEHETALEDLEAARMGRDDAEAQLAEARAEADRLGAENEKLAKQLEAAKKKADKPGA